MRIGQWRCKRVEAGQCNTGPITTTEESLSIVRPIINYSTTKSSTGMYIHRPEALQKEWKLVNGLWGLFLSFGLLLTSLLVRQVRLCGQTGRSVSRVWWVLGFLSIGLLLASLIFQHCSSDRSGHAVQMVGRCVGFNVWHTISVDEANMLCATWQQLTCIV